MKKLVFALIMSFLVSCSSSDNLRGLSSSTKDLSGTYLGVADYKIGHKGPNKAAIRIYLNEIPEERGSYHAVLLEYTNLLKMAPQYVASNKLPSLNNIIGYLKHITNEISVYKIVPADKQGSFKMYPLKVVKDNIVADTKTAPRILKLSDEAGATNLLAGATISSVAEGQPKEIFFPAKDDEKINGVQYTIAKLTYERKKLDSTWRKNFLPGPYLSAYARLDDTVLKLTKKGNVETAHFVLNPEKAKLSKTKREGMFTNAKSAFLKGEFAVSKPIDGMFLFRSVSSDKATIKEVSSRIGLFIDIFDATKALNQDVVEIAFINPNDPKDFLMYYEHPDNGEGN